VVRASPSKAQITILYDAFGKDPAMQKDWGYAALVEYGGKRILFDTGNNPEVLAQNAKAKSIDLGSLDFVVMSHRHGDHMGGLAYSSLPSEQRYYGGAPPDVMRFGSAWPGANFQLVDKTVQVVPDGKACRPSELESDC
jgi:7,8-dihydropterin-6-yl-methyl-4-(beta-D-ribofuranosyl)aminobenzene 5'-phosphate synthase